MSEKLPLIDRMRLIGYNATASVATCVATGFQYALDFFDDRNVHTITIDKAAKQVSDVRPEVAEELAHEDKGQNE